LISKYKPKKDKQGNIKPQELKYVNLLPKLKKVLKSLVKETKPN